jgi:hypothetical protein
VRNNVRRPTRPSACPDHLGNPVVERTTRRYSGDDQAGERAMDILTIEHFKPHAGKFVRFQGTPYRFILDRVEGESGPAPPGYDRGPFVVIFRGPSKTEVMGAGLYDCEIEDGPVFSLYVMPIYTARRDCQEYQAAFN